MILGKLNKYIGTKYEWWSHPGGHPKEETKIPTVVHPPEPILWGFDAWEEAGRGA